MSKCKKEITLKRIGWRLSGEATIQPYMGGQGIIEMKPWEIVSDEDFEAIPQEEWTNRINDNGFGAESIISADICVEAIYQGGYKKYFSSYYGIIPKNNQGVRGI